VEKSAVGDIKTYVGDMVAKIDALALPGGA
jgi:hypothetical protein